MARKNNDGLLLGPLLYPNGKAVGEQTLFSIRMHELDMEFMHQMKRLKRAVYRAKRAQQRHLSSHS